VRLFGHSVRCGGKELKRRTPLTPQFRTGGNHAAPAENCSPEEIWPSLAGKGGSQGKTMTAEEGAHGTTRGHTQSLVNNATGQLSTPGFSGGTAVGEPLTRKQPPRRGQRASRRVIGKAMMEERPEGGCSWVRASGREARGQQEARIRKIERTSVLLTKLREGGS